MADPFIAEIRMFTGSFAPKGWAVCDGQLMSISQNTALFSLLGTTYGGNGTSNFALPNLQGCVPMHPGQGPGLSLHNLGETGGEQTVTLLETEIPGHSHAVMANAQPGRDGTPAGEALARSVGSQMYQTATSTNLVQLHYEALSPGAGNLPHNNMQPFLGLTFIIALQGVYPARS